MIHKKVFPTAGAAVDDLYAGASICVSGFGPIRNRPMGLVRALAARPEINDLTIVVNSFHFEDLARQKQMKHMIAAFGGSVYHRDDPVEELIRSGDLQFEPCPQGTLVERLRAGAAGIPAFYSPVGVDTVIAEGKERRSFDGRDHILETALRPDFGFIRVEKADEAGNLVSRGSSLNFSPTMAAASRITIAEADEIVPVGAIPPNEVDIPGIFVHRVVLHDTAMDEDLSAVQSRSRERRQAQAEERPGLSRELMALRVAHLLKPGQVVNLGMGLPTLVANFIGPESEVILHAENGVLGYGPEPSESEQNWNQYNAQGQMVSVLPGASFFSSLDAFTMARGGRIDVVVLGGMQVSQDGDLANWWAPHMAAGGMGGAMDLCTNVEELVVLMEHTTREGEPKILTECAYPLTAARCTTKIVTDLALIEVTPDGLLLKETAPGISAEYVQERTEPRLIVAGDLGSMQA